MAENRIRLATTDPSLKDKISVYLPGSLERVYWYIRFNIPLNAETVTNKNMKITDMEGYIMHTDIHYDGKKNQIVVSPLDSYAEGIYYLLNITKKVESQKGQPLKREINILFKLINGQISEFELLKSTARIPKPIARPHNYDDMVVKRYSASSPVSKTEGKIENEKLDFKEMNINILICIAGIILTVISFYLGFVPLIAVSLAVCLAGVAHVFMQGSKPEFRGAVQYNLGVLNFNNGKYEKAAIRMDQAAKILPGDKDITFALARLKFYK